MFEGQLIKTGYISAGERQKWASSDSRQKKKKKKKKLHNCCYSDAGISDKTKETKIFIKTLFSRFEKFTRL